MTNEEIFNYMAEYPVECKAIIYRLLREDKLSLAQLVKWQEVALKNEIREQRRDLCEGAVVASSYLTGRWGGETGVTREQLDERARNFVNQVGCFPKIENV